MKNLLFLPKCFVLIHCTHICFFEIWRKTPLVSELGALRWKKVQDMGKYRKKKEIQKWKKEGRNLVWKSKNLNQNFKYHPEINLLHWNSRKQKKTLSMTHCHLGWSSVCHLDQHQESRKESTTTMRISGA